LRRAGPVDRWATTHHSRAPEIVNIRRPIEWLREHVDGVAVANPADAAADHVARLLAPHKRPRTVRLVEALPRNAMGKVLKRQLSTMT
jgi:acyl-CoA synthetase (AMP-forming)/AMP-acid ligase II